MISWIAANAATIIIILIIAVLAALALRHVYRNKGGCSCGCKKSCGGCSTCHPEEEHYDKT